MFQIASAKAKGNLSIKVNFTYTPTGTGPGTAKAVDIDGYANQIQIFIHALGRLGVMGTEMERPTQANARCNH